MTIIAHVCAEFVDSRRNPIYKITPAMLGGMQENVPDAIQEDPLFTMLIADGSLKAVVSADDRKAIEKNPLEGITAEGRKKKPTKEKISETSGDPE